MEKKENKKAQIQKIKKENETPAEEVRPHNLHIFLFILPIFRVYVTPWGWAVLYNNFCI
jgi:hypothetical protein